MAETAYDRVAYPSAIFERTHPERLAVLAMMHGLAPAPTETMRVLEIGCGDGLNVIALAAAFPDASFSGFDLAARPIEKGRALAAQAGLGNITLEVLDALDSVDHYSAGSFDYVIAHGVYAWVPQPVQTAIMALIGHVLAPDGIAFVSYNALPGGYIRHAMRDMLLLETAGIDDFDAKMSATTAFLEGLKTINTRGDESVELIRVQAAAMLERPISLLFHDELSSVFDPKSLTEVVRAAEAVGLQFLNEGGRNRHFDGFINVAHETPADPYAAVLRDAQMDDYLTMRYFRQTLFVRAEAKPSRQVDLNSLDSMWVTSEARVDAASGRIMVKEEVVEIADEAAATAMREVIEAGKARRPVAGLFETAEARAALMRLHNQWTAQLHTGPPGYALAIGKRPCSSPLARAMIANGETRICTLDHRIIELNQPGLRALLAAADGTRTIAEITDSVSVEFDKGRIPAAYAACCAKALMVT